MDGADVYLPVCAVETRRRITVGQTVCGYFDMDQLGEIVLVIIQPQFPLRLHMAFKPGDEKPVTYPIEEKKG